ncbi:unnamed protein product [Ixodes persulcatus]
MSDEVPKPQEGKADSSPTPSTLAAEAASQESMDSRENVSTCAEDDATPGACGGTSDPTDFKQFATQRELDIMSWVRESTKRAVYSGLRAPDDNLGARGDTRPVARASPWSEDCSTFPSFSGIRAPKGSPAFTAARTTRQQPSASFTRSRARDGSSQCFQTAFIPPDQTQYISDLLTFIRDLDRPGPSFTFQPRRDGPAGDAQEDDVEETLTRLEASLPEINAFVDSICEEGSPKTSPKK